MSHIDPTFGLILEADDIFAPLPRCRGFEIEPGSNDFSGCAIGDDAAPQDNRDVCPACNNTGVRA